MKLSLVNFAIAVLISALIAYGFYTLSGEGNRYCVTLGSFCFCASTLCLMIGVAFERRRTGVNLKIVCSLFLGVGLALNLLYALVPLSTSSYLIVSGLCLSVFTLAFRGVLATRQ